MTSPEEIRRRIESALPGAEVQVADTTGAGDHFEVRVRAAGAEHPVSARPRALA